MTPRFDPAHPANADLVRHFSRPERLGRLRSGIPLPDCAPDEVADPYAGLGTHPDLVERLWDQLGGALPADCRRVVYGRPMLVHPETGVAFAFAVGTSAHGLRLPPAEHAQAVAARAECVVGYPAYPDLGIAARRFDVWELGREWVLLGWLPGEEAWCAAAYRHAGTAPREG